jgi:hypothetical protein
LGLLAVDGVFSQGVALGFMITHLWCWEKTRNFQKRQRGPSSSLGGASG